MASPTKYIQIKTTTSSSLMGGAYPPLFCCTKNRSKQNPLRRGGREWIRTTEVEDNRFTVCPLWPLGNSPICKGQANAYPYFGAGDGTRTRDLLITNQLLYQLSYTSIWWELQGSNL